MNKTNKLLAAVLVPVVLVQICMGTTGAFGCVCPQDASTSPADPPIVSTNQDAVNEWPRFLGSQIDGKSENSALPHGIRKDWSEDRLPLTWQADVGEGYAIGVVSGERYYHFDKFEDAARLRSIDAKTGALVWKYEYPSSYRDLYGYDSGPRSSPLVDRDHIYLFGVEGRLTCLSTEDGDVVWSVDTAKKFGVIQNFFGVSSNPVIHDDKIIVMVGGSPEESAQVPQGQLDRVKPNGSAIVAFDKLTGDVKYETGNDLASYSSLTWLKTGRGKTLLAWCRGSALGIDPNDGRVEFEFPWRAKKLESVNAMTPVVHGNRFLLAECYELGSALVEVNDDKCNVIWSDRGRRKKSLAAHWGTPVLHQGYVYGCSGRHSSGADLRCVELATGEVKWTRRGFGRCSVTLVGGNLILLGERGRLMLVEATPEEFRLITERAASDEFSLEPNCWAAPIIAGGRLYVRGGKKVGCFELTKSP